MGLKDALRTVAQFIQDLEADKGQNSEPQKESPRIWYSQANLGGLMLWGGEAERYISCLKQLHESVPSKEHLSQKAIESLLQSAILKALDITDQRPSTTFSQRLDESLEGLSQALQAKPDKWEIHFRVMGLASIGLPRTVGKVEFYLAEETHLNVLIDKTNSIIEAGSNTIEQKQAAKEDISKGLGEYFKDTTIARIEVEAVDQVAARSMALRELRLTLDVINFYADVIHPGGLRTRVFLPGEAEHLVDTSLALKAGLKPSFNYLQSVEGPLQEMSLAELSSEKTTELGFVRISEILAKPQRNKLEERILSAFQWAGRATVDVRREEAFLLYAIALESLILGPKNDVELGYRLRTKCAHLLGLNLESKKRIQKTMVELYRTRSKIVHSGSVQVTDADLHTIRFITKNALAAVLVEEQFAAMKTEEEFEQWFENKMLGG